MFELTTLYFCIPGLDPFISVCYSWALHSDIGFDASLLSHWTRCFIDLWDCFGVEWESLELRVTEVLRWCKQNEVRHSSSEDQNAKRRAGDMTQQFRALPAFAENTASVSSSHVGWFTAT